MIEYFAALEHAPLWMSLLGLFVLAFLSASLLPMGSVWLLMLLLARGDAPWLLWAVATAGNTLGGMLNYALGWYASAWVKRQQSPKRWAQAEYWYNRYGVWSLLLSWLPIIGDPLTLVAGVMRTHFGLFMLLVGLGKAARYAAVVFGFVAVS